MEGSTAKKLFKLFKANYHKIIAKQSYLPLRFPIVTGVMFSKLHPDKDRENRQIQKKG